MTLPVPPVKGQPVRAETVRQIIDCLRMFRPLSGRNTRTRTTPGGTIIDGTPGGGAGTYLIAPWTVRHHFAVEADAWEIWLPPGCMSVGGTLTPINKPASSVEGHGNDKPGWYLIKLDEDGASVVETETEGEGEAATTTRWKVWDIVAHAKTSAKVYGADTVDATSRRLLYVSARARLTDQESQAQTDADKVADTWGDEFAQTVAVVRIGERTAGGETTAVRRVVQAAIAPISVQGRAPAGFDLVWYFGVGNDGGLSVERVLCVRTVAQAAGMALTGPEITEVQGATKGIWAKIVTNPLAHQNQVEVVVDPTNTQGGDFLTWLKLYDMTSDAVAADYRTTALANVQVYR